MNAVHFAVDLVNHGWEVEVAVGKRGGTVSGGAGGNLAAHAHASALLTRPINVCRDIIQMLLRNQRTGLGLLIERTTELDVSGALDQIVDKLLGDGLLHNQASARRADLTGVQERSIEGIVQSSFVVSVGEDDVRVLAAELKCNLLHGLGCFTSNNLASDKTASEGDHVHLRMRGQRCARFGASAGNEVGNTCRNTQIIDDVHEQNCCVRSQLRRLEHKGIARGQARCDLPCGLQQWVVPRRDQATDTDRFTHNTRDDGRVIRIHETTGIIARELTEVLEAGDDVIHIGCRLRQALAGIHSLCPGKFILTLPDGSTDVEYQPAALSCAPGCPGTFSGTSESSVGGGNGALGVGRVCFRNFGDERAIGRALNSASVASGCSGPGTVDEQRGRAFVGFGGLGCEGLISSGRLKGHLGILLGIVVRPFADRFGIIGQI